MIHTTTSFKSIEADLSTSIKWLQAGDFNKGWSLLEGNILSHKVKFPVLEKLAVQFHRLLPPDINEYIIQRAAQARHISAYPLIGKIIQLQLPEGLSSAYTKAREHIIQGDEWYACDIIAERVFGEGNLYDFKNSLTELRSMASHPNLWVQRSVGIAAHYATKKGLPKGHVEELFLLILENGHKTQLYIKKGIGWAAKTIAKFHPDIIHRNQAQISQTPKLSRWFLKKIDIGLSMANAKSLSR